MGSLGIKMILATAVISALGCASAFQSSIPGNSSLSATSQSSPATSVPASLASNALSISSPSNGASAQGTIAITGTAGSQWVNVAAFNSAGLKLGGDASPSGNAYSLAIDSTQLINGLNTISVFAYSVPAGELGGASAKVSLTLNVQNAVATPPPSPAPAAAAAVGYNAQTFGPAGSLGGNWYSMSFDGNDPALSGATQNGDGTINISGAGGDNGYNAQIATASAGGTPTSWTGHAFGGGGYFEATLSFTGAPSTNGGWPSFWANTVEGMSGSNAATNNSENIEVDAVEFDTEWAGLSFGSGLHDWYGSGSQVSTTGNSPQLIPAGTDLSQPHKYAFLWVPATATAQGFIKFYFDGAEGPNVTAWSPYNPSLSPTSNPYAVLDIYHLVLIIGTGPGNPMTVHGVSVWQSSGANNISQ